MSNTSNSEAETGSQPAGKMRLSNFSFIEDVEITISVQLDQRSISLQELVHLEVGNVLTFSRAAGENVDVFAGDVLLGNAEILVLDDKLAVRMADIRDATQR